MSVVAFRCLNRSNTSHLQSHFRPFVDSRLFRRDIINRKNAISPLFDTGAYAIKRLLPHQCCAKDHSDLFLCCSGCLWTNLVLPLHCRLVRFPIGCTSSSWKWRQRPTQHSRGTSTTGGSRPPTMSHFRLKITLILRQERCKQILC